MHAFTWNTHIRVCNTVSFHGLCLCGHPVWAVSQWGWGGPEVEHITEVMVVRCVLVWCLYGWWCSVRALQLWLERGGEKVGQHMMNRVVNATHRWQVTHSPNHRCSVIQIGINEMLTKLTQFNSYLTICNVSMWSLNVSVWSHWAAASASGFSWQTLTLALQAFYFCLPVPWDQLITEAGLSLADGLMDWFFVASL